MLSINSNLSALYAHGTMSTNSRGLAQVMAQLSTGKRINSSADDVAGLAISTRLTSQIRGLNQAIRNGNDAISMLQTADSAAESITNMLQRMRELSVQYKNDTNNSNDRSYINQEISGLKVEVSRVVANTTWNGTNLLDGTGANGQGSFSFQLGANASNAESIQAIISSLSPPADFTGQLSGIKFTAADIINPATQFYWDPASGGNGHIYEWVHHPAITWTQARSEASSQSISGNAGYLATITSQAEMDFIENTVIPGGPSSDNTYIGGHHIAGTNNTWQWTDGPEAGTAFWNDGPIAGQFVTWPPPNLPIGPSNYQALPTWGSLGINGSFQPYFTWLHGTPAAPSAAGNTGYVVEWSAPTTIDSYLNTVSNVRANISALVTRLQSSVDAATSTSTNLQTSRSRIEDTDYSQATTELAKRNIIQQAAQAMLAQANQQPQAVLQLLKSTA